MKHVATWGANYTASSARAQTAYTEGVNATTKDQAALAVAAIPRMVAGFNQAASSGRIASGLQRGGTAYWKSQTVLKAGAYSLGITNGANNYNAAAQKIGAFMQSAVPSLPPRGDINQNLQRGNALALALHAQKGNLGAR